MRIVFGVRGTVLCYNSPSSGDGGENAPKTYWVAPLHIFKGIANHFHSVQVSNTAAMVRMAVQTTTVLPKMKMIFDDAFNRDDIMMQSLVSDEVPGFDTPAIVSTLQRAIDSAFLPDIQRTSWTLYLSGVRGNMQSIALQSALYKYSKTASSDFNPNEFISKRMQRWMPSVSDLAKEWCVYCGPFMLQLCQNEVKGAPQCVIAAVLKTVLNGWATARKMQQQQTRCIFQCGSSQDCVEHYLSCNVVERIWEKIFNCDWGPFESRLAVGAAIVRDRVFRAYFLYAIYGTHNFLRHNPTVGRALETCTTITRSKLNFALGRLTAQIRQLFSAADAVSPAPASRQESLTIGDVMFNFRKRSQLCAKDDNGKRHKICGKRVKTAT